MGDLPRGDVPAADCLGEIVHGSVIELAGEFFQVDVSQPQLAQFPLQDVFAALDVLFAGLLFEPAADFGARPLGFDHPQVGVQPVPAGSAAFGGQDVHLIPGFQLVVEGHQFPADLSAPAAVPDLRVDVVSEINRGGTGGQINDVAAGGENIHPVPENIGFHAVHELTGVFHVLPPLHQLADVVHPAVEIRVVVTALLVPPVGGDPVFGALVHLLGADLHLQGFAVIVNHGGVQGLVEIILGGGDVIVKFAGDGPPGGVDSPQSLVTLLFGGEDDTHAAHIVNHLEGHALALHLAVDGIDMLGAGGDVCLKAGLLHHLHQADFDRHHLPLALGAAFLEAAGDLVVGLRVDVAQGKVFQFPLDLPDTEAVRQRSEDVHRLLGDAPLLVRRHVVQCAHIVQAVRQFDQHHAGVIRHRQEGFAEGFRGKIVAAAAHQVFGFLLGGEFPAAESRLPLLPLFGGFIHPVAARDPGEGGQFGDRVDHTGDVLPEIPLDVLQGDLGVFNGIMQKPRRDDLGRDLHIGQNGGDGEAMGDVRLTGDALLLAVGFLRDAVSPHDQLAILRQVIRFGQAFQQGFDGHARSIIT